MANNKMDVKIYIDQFHVLATENDVINCENISHILYSTILNRFKTTMTQEEYAYFKEYQERVFDLIENLRELSSSTIPIVLNYLNRENHYLVDIVIMLWCLPRSDTYLSKRIYNNNYKQNIQKYNFKMIKNIEQETIKNFCIETLTKTNNVPIHCIDYLWFYMNTISLEFLFYNSESNAYISFIMPEHSGKGDDEYIEFGFNMEYLLELGLGQVTYPTDITLKGSFRNFLKRFVTDVEVVKKLLTIKTASNYKKQLINISKNPSKYFGDTLTLIPQEVIDLIQ